MASGTAFNRSVAIGDGKTDVDTIDISRREYPVIQPVNPIDGITYGLELLIDTSHLIIIPQCGQGDYIVGEKNANHYDIVDCSQGRIYFAWETDVNGFGKLRTYTLKVVDFSGRPVLQITKFSNCLSCLLKSWFNCFGSTGTFVTVNTPDGVKVGELKQTYNGWKPKFNVRNQYKQNVMSIVGPPGGDCCYNFNIPLDVEFPILRPDGEPMGSVTKTCLEPMGTNLDDYFEVRFPKELKVEEKATLLGSVFAINVMFFERGSYKPPDVVQHYEQVKKQERRQSRRQSMKNDLEALGLPLEEDDHDKYIADQFVQTERRASRRQSLRNDYLEALGLSLEPDGNDKVTDKQSQDEPK